MPRPHRNLRRLQPEAYRGLAAVHWIFTTHDRAVGWLKAEFHYHFREVLTHVGIRYGCATPVYCLMPDHMHVMLWGFREDADLYVATRFLRKHTAEMLLPSRYQKQAYDHVLQEKEIEQDGFESVCFYIAENPVRAKLVGSAKEYPFSGSVLPGYPGLRIHEEGYWELFWKIVHRLTAAATAP
jgi:putative transposase